MPSSRVTLLTIRPIPEPPAWPAPEPVEEPGHEPTLRPASLEAGPRLPPRATPLDNATAALHYIDEQLSTPVPAGSAFPSQVLPGWNLDFTNFKRITDNLAAQLQVALPPDRATAPLHAAMAGMSDRLVAGVQHWYSTHPRSSKRLIPRDQFNLLVTDEFRYAFDAARKLATNDKATPGQRAVASVLADLLRGLKRLHYSSNVQHLYKANGERALAVFTKHPENLQYGFREAQSSGLSVAGGVRFASHTSNLDLLVPISYSKSTEFSVAEDGDPMLLSKHAFGPSLTANFQVGSSGENTLMTGSAKLSAEGQFGRTYKAPSVAQLADNYGERHKHDVLPFMTSASASQRRVVATLATLFNGAAKFFNAKDKPFDTLHPTHASVAKHMKGMYIEEHLAEKARELDRLVASSARDPMRDSPGRAGAFEALIVAAYPSHRQRMEAMGPAENWTAAQVTRDIPGQNTTKYAQMPRNASRSGEETRFPYRGTALSTQADMSIGPKQTFKSGTQSASGEPGDGLTADVGSMQPALQLTLTPPPFHNHVDNHVQRLASPTELTDVGAIGDFAPVLAQLEQMRRHYAAGVPGGGLHPHLILMQRFDAMAQCVLTLPADASMAAGRGRDLAPLRPLVFGDLDRIPTPYRAAIGTVLSGHLSPADLLRGIVANLRMTARQYADFKADATSAWAMRGSAAGDRTLHRMNGQYFDNQVPLSSSSTSTSTPSIGKLEDADYRAFIGRAYDANTLPLVNLATQLSVARYLAAKVCADANPETKSELQRLADEGAVAYKALVAIHNEHNLPIAKDEAWHRFSIASTASSPRDLSEASVNLDITAGALELTKGLSFLPLPEMSFGDVHASVSYTATRQTGSTNPLREGLNLDIAADVAGGPSFPQIALPLLYFARRHSQWLKRASELPTALFEDLARSSTSPFGQVGARFTARYRVPPDEIGERPGGDRPPSVRLLQYWRAVVTTTTQIERTTPNALAAVAPGLLKVSVNAQHAADTPVMQENGPCPAYNALYWRTHLRQYMVDTATGRPWPYERIAANMKGAPRVMHEHFSRFVPTMTVPTLFAEAVTHPRGPRNEFHRMLNDVDGARQRDYAPEVSRHGAGSSTPLFAPAPEGGHFHALSEQARSWPPLDTALIRRVATMRAPERARFFLEDPVGQGHMGRYIAIMELADQFNNVGKPHGRGYALNASRGLIASRTIKAAQGLRKPIATRLADRFGAALHATRLKPEPGAPAHHATVAATIGVAPSWERAA